MTTNAQISAQITDLLTKWNAREAQFRDWLGGAATGGPNGDGKFPLTDASGTTQNVNSPASLSSTVTGPSATAVAAKDAAEDARDASASSAGASATSAEQAAQDRTIARQWRDEAEVFRNDAANSQGGSSAASASAIAARDQAVAARDVVLPARDEVVEAQTEATQAAAEALISRDAAAAFAASINPAILATKAELASEIDAILGAAPGALDTLAELAAALGNNPNFATTVTNSLAGKAPLVHTHVPADITGLDTLLAGKAPVTHGHGMVDITGLTAALDGKAPVTHGHAVTDITGLTAALAGKLGLTGGMVTGAFGVQDSGSNGFARIQPGGPANTGHIEFLTSTGARRGFLGFADANWVYMTAENGTAFYFNHRPNFNGATPWDSGNFNPASKADAAHVHPYVALGGDNILDGLYKFRSNMNTATGSSPDLQAYADDDTKGAIIAFHRYAQYAVNMGLDNDNVFRIGGWSAPPNLLQLTMGGDLTLRAGCTLNDHLTLTKADTGSRSIRFQFTGDEFSIGRTSSSFGTVFGWLTPDTNYMYTSGGLRVGNSSGAVLLAGPNISVIGKGNFLHHASKTSGQITTSTASPSGGGDGDIWLKV